MTASELRHLFASTDQPEPSSKGLQVGATHFHVSESEGGVCLYAFQGSKEQGRVATSTLLQEMSPAQARELALGLDQIANAVERSLDDDA